MNIAVLGTGMVGDTIGSKLIELGHTVMLGSRSPENEKSKAFIAKHKNRAQTGKISSAAEFGEIIFNCTPGTASVEILKTAGEKNLNGKILIDVSNSLEFGKGKLPTLAVCNNSSVGEEIQNAFPQVKVVKTFNTIWCGLMVNPGMINGGDHTNFICGNDSNAKERVKGILKSFGWAEKNVIDLGDITGSRGMEMYLPLWLRIYGATNNGAFNFKMVS